MLHQLVAQTTGAAQAAQVATDGGGIPIGYVLGMFGTALLTMVGVVKYLNGKVEKAHEKVEEHHEETVADLKARLDRKDAVIAALKEQVNEHTSAIIALHATAGPDRDKTVRALRAATRVLARLTHEAADDEGDEDDG